MRKWVRTTARGLSHRVGVELTRYPQSNQLWRSTRLLQRHQIDTVIDVGANDGGFAAGIRLYGYKGRIQSYEPLSMPFAALQRKSNTDPKWTVDQYAIGSETAEVEINIAGNGAASSSVLPMLDLHADTAPTSRYVGTETVSQRKLDELMPTLNQGGAQRIFLKIDVQGYEHHVLDGAKELLMDPRTIGLQIELSLVPLYEGAMTWRDGLDRMDRLGMDVFDIMPGFGDSDGRLLQADIAFYRP